MLDWERAEQEDTARWERLLERLRQRGVSAEKGLKLIVSDGSEGLAAAAVTATLAGSKEENRKRRREVVKEAAAIRQGQDRAEIPRRQDEFVAKRRGEEPEAVATLLRNVEKTIAYCELAKC